MKNLLKRCALLLSVLAVVFLFTACSSSGHILPDFVSDNDAYTIEHVNNIEKSYVLYEYKNFVGETEKFELKHEEYEEWNSIAFAWLIKKGDDVAGFIYTSGGSKVDNKDKSNYSYGVPYDNLNEFADTVSISVYLIGQDAEYMENNVSLAVNYGTVAASSINDTDIEGLAIKGFIFDLSGVRPKDVTEIVITLSLR